MATVTTLPSFPPTPAPECPEAAFSLCLRGTLAGLDAQLTIRAQTAEAFRAQVAAMRGLLDQPAASPPDDEAPPDRGPGQAPPTSQKSWCGIHDVPMERQRNARGAWWSHRLPEGGFCKGK